MFRTRFPKSFQKNRSLYPSRHAPHLQADTFRARFAGNRLAAQADRLTAYGKIATLGLTSSTRITQLVLFNEPSAT